MSLPSTMKATLLTGIGDPSNFKYTTEQPLPQAKEGEVLVKNNVAGINYIDIYFRSGSPGYNPPLPIILGQEAAGTIASISTSSPNPYGFSVGDRVVWLKQGSYAEYTAVPQEKVYKIPDDVSDEDAVGVFLMGMTALSLIKEGYEVKRETRVLVHAAAGGVGLLMCQLLRDVGAWVVGTAGGPEKCKLALKNGATHCIDYKKTDGPGWVEQVKELTDGKGVDVVYDSIGKDTWEGSFEVAARKGKVVFFGQASGMAPPIPLPKLQAKNLSTMRSTLIQTLVTREEFEYYASAVLNLVKDRKLNVKIYKVYPLKNVQEAHRDLESRKTTGKLLLKI